MLVCEVLSSERKCPAAEAGQLEEEVLFEESAWSIPFVLGLVDLGARLFQPHEIRPILNHGQFKPWFSCWPSGS